MGVGTLSFVLGIDAGGTSTRCVAVDTSGRVLGRATAGPGNFLAVGPERAGESIRDAVNGALAQAGLQGRGAAMGCIGIAGSTNPEERALLERLLSQLGAASRWIIDVDAAIALAAGTFGEPGVVVIAGTGSIAFGISSDGRRARAGGWGYLLGDEGSAFDIGRRALVAALRSADGRGPHTLLEAFLMAELHLPEITDVVGPVYRGELDRAGVAALAPVVIATAAQGDPVAGEILQNAGAELALAAVAVIRELGMEAGPTPVALSGGLFLAGEVVLNAVRSKLSRDAPNARVVFPRIQPVEAAALLALSELGIKPSPPVIDALSASPYGNG